VSDCLPKVGFRRKESFPPRPYYWCTNTMRITQVYASKEARDGAVACGMDEGMEACYKQLDVVLAQSA
jgi:hypothetical protein